MAIFVNKVLLQHPSVYASSVAALCHDGSVVTRETLWPREPKTFPIWPFTESVLSPALGLRQEKGQGGKSFGPTRMVRWPVTAPGRPSDQGRGFPLLNTFLRAGYWDVTASEINAISALWEFKVVCWDKDGA